MSWARLPTYPGRSKRTTPAYGPRPRVTNNLQTLLANANLAGELLGLQGRADSKLDQTFECPAGTGPSRADIELEAISDRFAQS